MPVNDSDREAADRFAGLAYLSALQHEALEQAFAAHRETAMAAQLAGICAFAEKLAKHLIPDQAEALTGLVVNLKSGDWEGS